MKTNNPARKHRSRIVSELLSEVTPVEKMQVDTKMTLAARLDDLITVNGWNKKEFAEKMAKNPSEVTKWLSGTHNFTIDTLSEIAQVLNCSVAELFVPKQMQVINKVQIIVKVKEVQPAFPFFTSFGGGAVLDSETIYAGTFHDTIFPLTSSFTA